MLSHMKSVVSRVSHALGTRSEESISRQQNKESPLGRLTSPLIYQRPLFLDLSSEDQQRALNHKTRCPCTPKSSNSLPFNSGYCEVVNAGKSTLNEDCSVALTVVLESPVVENCNCPSSTDNKDDAANETPREQGSDVLRESTDGSPNKDENKEITDNSAPKIPSS